VRVGILNEPDSLTAPDTSTILAERFAASQAKFPSPSSKVRGAFFIIVAPVFGSEEERNIIPII
jgi:hypothetical protein